VENHTKSREPNHPPLTHAFAIALTFLSVIPEGNLLYAFAFLSVIPEGNLLYAGCRMPHL
jgi:hypothetical protein